MSEAVLERTAGALMTIDDHRSLLEAAEELTQVGRWQWIPSEGELRWSDGLFRIFGFEPGEIAPTLEWLADRTHPDDRERMAGAVEALREAGELAPLHYRVLRPDGTVRHVRATLSVAELRDGRPHRLVGWCQDVTEVLRAEREIAAHNAVTQALGAWESLRTGGRRLVGGLAEAMGCAAGALWVPEGETLAARVLWRAADAELEAFEAATLEERLPPGAGLAGRAWATGEPATVVELRRAPRGTRHRAAVREGLRGMLAIPAVNDGEVLTVVELASREPIELTARLLQSLNGIGHEVGQFLARRRGDLRAPLLTAREREVLQLAAHGLSGPETAQRLVLSRATVRSHLENIYAKLGVSDKPSAVATALRQGLID